VNYIGRDRYDCWTPEVPPPVGAQDAFDGLVRATGKAFNWCLRTTLIDGRPVAFIKSGDGRLELSFLGRPNCARCGDLSWSLTVGLSFGAGNAMVWATDGEALVDLLDRGISHAVSFSASVLRAFGGVS